MQLLLVALPHLADHAPTVENDRRTDAAVECHHENGDEDDAHRDLPCGAPTDRVPRAGVRLAVCGGHGSTIA